MVEDEASNHRARRQGEEWDWPLIKTMPSAAAGKALVFRRVAVGEVQLYIAVSAVRLADEEDCISN